MSLTYIPWTPVYNHGCGWRECPQCGPMIELEIEATHRRRVEATCPRRSLEDQVSEWLGEVSGTGPERAAAPTAAPKRAGGITKAERALARAQRDRGRERVRVRRTLTADQTALAADTFKRTPLRRAYLRRNARRALTRTEWLTEAWLELLNPSALVARAERGAAFGDKLRHAIERGQRNMNAENKQQAREREASGANLELEAA